jgi:hypothetical protein
MVCRQGQGGLKYSAPSIGVCLKLGIASSSQFKSVSDLPWVYPSIDSFVSGIPLPLPRPCYLLDDRNREL